MQRLLISLICVCSLGVTGLAQFHDDGLPDKRPNIIFILADDMGFSDMGFLGSPVRTPNLDRLRHEGMYLSRHYTQPQCTPTRAAFLTGQYPYRFGMHEHIILPWSLNGIPDSLKTIAGMMKDAGYQTAIVGKWHVGGYLYSQLPHHRGFDYSFSAISGMISYWNYTSYGLNDIVENGRKYFANTLTPDSEAGGNQYATYLWRDKAIDVVKNRDKEKPMFMYLAFTAPHHPLHVPKTLLDTYDLDSIGSYWSGPNAEKGRTAASRRYYMAMMEAMDSAIGNLLETLESEGILKNTLIVFSSDNGGIIEADNRPLRSVKGDSYEGGIRVPGIVYWPGKVKSGSVSAELVYIADWYATFADVAGHPLVNRIDGISAVNVMLGGKGNRVSVPIISAGRHAYVTSTWSLVGGGEDYQHLLANKLSGFNLYDLSNDVSQQLPVEDRESVKEELRQTFMPHFQQINRGYFNWDIKYNKSRLRTIKGDHTFDYAINDLPDLKVSKSHSTTSVTITPVNNELAYALFGKDGSEKWHFLEAFIPEDSVQHHSFILSDEMAHYEEYQVKSRVRFGLPIVESFDTPAYTPGVIRKRDQVMVDSLLPSIDGLLRYADIRGGSTIRILPKSLPYGKWPMSGGALAVSKSGDNAEAYLTRYFVEPHSTGPVYVSFLAKFQGSDAECQGEINLLRQVGTETKNSFSLSLGQDGVFAGGGESLRPYTDGDVICVLFEISLGTTNADRINVYINPDVYIEPIGTFNGEFTFDRLQFRTVGRVGGTLTVDEVRVGNTRESVVFAN